MARSDRDTDDVFRQEGWEPPAAGRHPEEGHRKKGFDPGDSAYAITDPLGLSKKKSPARDRTPAVEIHGLNHVLGGHGGTEGQFRLQIDELSVPRGCFCSITGPNGCGKTTLLTIMGLLQKPTEVQAFIIRTGHEGQLTEHRIEQLWQTRSGRRTIQGIRRSGLGFVLQSGGLLESQTAYENINFVLRANGRSPAGSRERIDEICARLNFADDWKPRTPTRLSGGQQQIAALARAVVHDPSLVLVDEPTASLHPDWARNTLTLLAEMQKERGPELTVIMVTHDATLAREFGTYHVKMQVDLEQMRGYVDTTEG